MATTAISIEEYLSTAYEPDMDYVDGELEERNEGGYEHNVVQKRILFWFDRRAKEWRIRAIQEQRTRLSASRVRIPDVSVFSRELPVEQLFTRPQLIAIEVLSPEDRHSKMDKKIQNYIDFGVRQVWVVDPTTRTGWDAPTATGSAKSDSRSLAVQFTYRCRSCSLNWTRLSRTDGH
jgi:Uma2 family endonuclease